MIFQNEAKMSETVEISQKTIPLQDLEAVYESMPDEDLLFDLAELFKIFGDSTRIKILFALLGRELSVGDIAEVLKMTQSAISHQLRVLKANGLVRFRREGKSLFYALSDDHVSKILNMGLEHIEE